LSVELASLSRGEGAKVLCASSLTVVLRCHLLLCIERL
jgi:hypothetical protein